MVQRVEQLGLKAHPIIGTERTVIAAIGDKRDEHRQSLESGPGVAEVVPILAPYKVASLEVKPERTVIRVGPPGGGQRAPGRDRRALRGGGRRADHRHRPGGQGGRRDGPARRGLQTADQPLQLPGTEGGRAAHPGRRPRGDRPARGDRGDGRRRRAAGGPLCRRAPDRRPQHAELPPPGGGRGAGQAGAARNAAPAPPSTSCCWRPSTSSTPATPT